MVGLGLKQSFRGGPFKVDPYAPMTQKQGQYNEIAEQEVQPLSAFIMSRFQNVWKCGCDAQIKMARKLKIPNFVAATLDTAEWNDNPGPNLLTITSNGFCNRHHKDCDLSEWTFGGAWGGVMASTFDKHDYRVGTRRVADAWISHGNSTRLFGPLDERSFF